MCMYTAHVALSREVCELHNYTTPVMATLKTAHELYSAELPKVLKPKEERIR